MSKINELIQTLCPDGVEYKKLGEVAEVCRGKRVVRRELSESDKDGYPVYQNSLTAMGYYAETNYPAYTTFIIGAGAAGEIGFSSTDFWAADDCFPIVCSSELIDKYAFYVLMNKKDFIATKVRKASIPRLAREHVEDLQIPIPPLPVQEEIVRILDEYTELEVELEAKLSEEIELKQKQYEVYRDELLTFGDEVEYKKLKDVSSFANGKGHEKNIVNDGRYIVVNSKFVSTNGIVKKYSDVQICPLCIDDILMVMSDLPNGRALAKCYLVDENDKYTLNQRIGCFHTLNENIISTKFLFNVLNRNYQLLSYDNGIDQTNLRKNAILNIDIPVPPLQEQQCIVEILDKYDTYTRDMVSALNTELDSRKKQYAYYRDQLLTFKRKE